MGPVAAANATLTSAKPAAGASAFPNAPVAQSAMVQVNALPMTVSSPVVFVNAHPDKTPVVGIPALP
jgi:hypothetical protein